MSRKFIKTSVFIAFSMLSIFRVNSGIMAGTNEGLTIGETVPNPEFLIQNQYEYDQIPSTKRLYDYKDGQNLLIAFMPDISTKNNYANVMTSAFDTYFAEGLAFKDPFVYDTPIYDLKVLVVTNNNGAEVKEYLSKMNIDFDMVSDINLDFANLFGITKWSSSAEGSFVYVVNKDNKITYASHDYTGEGEKLKSVQKELFSLLGINETATESFANYRPLMPGDDARDFSFSYQNTDPYIHNPDILRDGKLSDYIGKKNVILAFYPAPFSVSCGMEVKRFDNFAAEEDFARSLTNNYGSGDDLEILMISVSNSSIIKKWKDEMGLKDIKLVSDNTGEISAMYSSYNPLGYNNRTLFLINKGGKVSYIDWNYVVDENDFALVKEHLSYMN
ncbi:MAG: redoxin domain-containing protein [Ignavibacteria bacterium]